MRRRNMLVGAGSAMLASPTLGSSSRAAETTTVPPQLPEGARQVARYVELPDKHRMLRLSDRPPNYASPINVYADVVTPNDRFYVSYVQSRVPTEDDMDDWSLTVAGDAVSKPLTLRHADLVDLPVSDVLAVCQSPGLCRGYADPHVPGIQWTEGAVGCAKWSGPALRDVLKAAGVKDSAVEVAFQGADKPAQDDMPRFRMSLPLEKAMAADTIVALSMNNAPLPMLNGYPARLVVPGWVGPYWMKHLTRIEVSSVPSDSYWMRSAFRVPAGKFPVGQTFSSQDDASTVPVTEMVVNSIIGAPAEGLEIERFGFTISGVAWDRGSGINRVEMSLDGGATWWSALLDGELGPHAFRRFSMRVDSVPAGPLRLMSRATANSGERQAVKTIDNPGGFLNNVPRVITVIAT